MQTPKRVSKGPDAAKAGVTKSRVQMRLGEMHSEQRETSKGKEIAGSGRFPRSKTALQTRAGSNGQACHSHLPMRRQQLWVVKWLAQDNTTCK